MLLGSERGRDAGESERGRAGEREAGREREREGGRRERGGGQERERGRAARWRRGFDVDAMTAAGVDLINFFKGWGRSRGFRRLG